MASKKVKEDEKIERAIRALLKLPDNRRCINCNSLGPQYVCTTFLTFVCTNCSGIHREFTHRVKSVSMAKFNADEVSALQAAGNGRAREIYFKEWDPERHFYPDSSNLHRLREFIRHVYMERRYSGEKSVDKLPRLRLNDKEEWYEPKKVSSFHGRSRSPDYEERFERRYSEKSSPAGRSDERSFKHFHDDRKSSLHAQENSKSVSYRKSSARFEIVDDRFRDDGPGSARRHDARMFSAGDSKQGNKSPEHQKNVHRSSSPAVRPVKDILGENASLQVGEGSRANDAKDADGSAHNKKTVSSSTIGSADGKLKEHKGGNQESLIDFNTTLDLGDAGSAQPTEHMTPANDGNEKASPTPSANSLEDLLFGLSVTTTVPVGNTSEASTGGNERQQSLYVQQHHLSASLDSQNSPNVQQHQLSTSPFALQLSNMQLQYQPASSATQQVIQPMASPNNQPRTSSFVPNAQGPSSGFAEHTFDAFSKPNQDTTVGGFPSLPSEVKPGGRTALPADIFTASYSSIPQPVQGWQTGPLHGMGYNTQYYRSAMHAHAISNSAVPTNPFDINDATTQVQALQLPSMASLQGALPNVSAPGGLSYTSNPRNQSQGLVPQQSPSYASMMLPQSTSFAPTLSPIASGAYMGQHIHSNVPPSRTQGIDGVSSAGDPFASLMTNQQSTGRYSAPSSTNDSYSSKAGNPFE